MSEKKLSIAKHNEQMTHEANKRLCAELFACEQQRDELLAALNLCREKIYVTRGTRLPIVESAIAKVKSC